jgi:hypothetical protein
VRRNPCRRQNASLGEPAATSVSGRSSAVLSRTAARSREPIPRRRHAGRDITFLPITGGPILRYAPVWRSTSETPLVRAVIQAADDARSGT